MRGHLLHFSEPCFLKIPVIRKWEPWRRPWGGEGRKKTVSPSTGEKARLDKNYIIQYLKRRGGV